MIETAASQAHVVALGYVNDVDTMPAWELYRTAMAPLAARAAQRHLLTQQEFVAIMRDGRVTKYLAVVDGQLIGLGVLVTDLAAWPLLSPEYYAEKFPGRKVFYVGFVAVAPRSHGVFGHLIEQMSEPVRAANGVAGMDFCTYNVHKRNIATRTDALLRHIDPRFQLASVDSQEYWTWDLSGGAE